MGNTLTGEFSRARLLRLRWPYVRRVVAETFQEEGRTQAELEPILARLEERFKAPFAPIDEDTLAGALSNTIAGRVFSVSRRYSLFRPKKVDPAASHPAARVPCLKTRVGRQGQLDQWGRTL